MKTIYAITYLDMYLYIGETVQPLNKRINSHKIRGPVYEFCKRNKISFKRLIIKELKRTKD